MRAQRPFDPQPLRRRGWTQAEIDFVAALSREQEGARMGNAAFAARLGVSDALWRHTRAGRKPLGLKLFAAGSDLVPYSVASAAHASLMDRAKGAKAA